MDQLVRRGVGALPLALWLSLTALPLAASIPGDLFEALIKRQNITNITSTTTTPSNTSFFEVDPVGITRSLPWWTSVVGGAISLLLGIYTISWGWKRQRPEDAAWSLSGTGAIKTITTAAGLFWTLFQSVSGLVHLHQNWGARALVRPASGNAYIGMFAMAAQLWSIKVRGRWMARIAAWIVAIAVIANFAIFTLPGVGSAPLYQLSSEWCSTVLDHNPTNIGFSNSGCEQYNSITQGAVSFACTNATGLQFWESHRLPQIVNYVFEAILGIMFLATLLWQVKTDFDWLSWRRAGGPTLPVDQTWQPPSHAGPTAPQPLGYPQDPYNNGYYNNNDFNQNKGPNWEAYPVTNDNRDPLRRDAYFGARNPHRFVAYAIAFGLYATNLVGIAVYALAYLSSKPDAVSATLGVCPGISNSTSHNVTAVFGTHGQLGVGNCTCVDLRLPGSVESLSVSLNMSTTNIARLLFNL